MQVLRTNDIHAWHQRFIAALQEPARAVPEDAMTRAAMPASGTVGSARNTINPIGAPNAG